MIYSNIKVKSNVYIRKGTLGKDVEFHPQVLEREGIKKLLYFGSLNENRDLTPLQREILSEGAPCSLNKEEIPYGLVKKNNGDLVWECRCEKIDCKYFNSCRPNISIDVIKNTQVAITLDEEIEDIYNLAKLKSIPRKKKDVSKKHIQKVEPIVVEIKEEKIPVAEKFVEKPDINIPLITKKVEQDVVVKAPIEDKIFVNAGPGTGKTHTLINRVKYITVEEQLLEPQELMILCFSRSAIGEINSRLAKSVIEDESLYQLNMLDVRTFDSFATYLIKFLEPEMNLVGKGYDERIEIAIDLMGKNPDVLKNYKHIIIDEIQDLVGVRARLVKTILSISHCGFTLLGDTCQSIYNYQVKDDPDEMDTNSFYNWILDRYSGEIKFYEFDKNYRQHENLKQITNNIRQAILYREPNKQRDIIMESLKSFKHLGNSYNIRNNLKETGPGKISLLCRNNGQALKVSNQMNSQGIEHELLKPANFKVLKPWLGEVLNCCEKLISYEDFKETLNFKYDIDEYEIQNRWYNLKDIEEGRSTKLNIKELSNNLAFKKHMYENLCVKQQENILVSTIHRAKGREFDYVLLLDDHMLKGNIDNLADEIKVYYVALTRPKKELYQFSLNNRNWIRKLKDKNGNGRWYETYRDWQTKKDKLNAIEVGREKDIDVLSFVSDDFFQSESNAELNQEYILKNVNKNDEVELRLVELKGIAVGYDIYHRETKIGRMSDQFLKEVYSILREVYGVFEYNAKYFPDYIREVYVDSICTYVLENEMITEENKYISNGIWNGITLTGFGKIRYGYY